MSTYIICHVSNVLSASQITQVNKSVSVCFYPTFPHPKASIFLSEIVNVLRGELYKYTLP